ncbi:MAG: adenine deaminase C-terminal domain-containing protein [Candidatus Binatia bacterium]
MDVKFPVWLGILVTISGRFADLVPLEDVDSFYARFARIGGKVVAEMGFHGPLINQTITVEKIVRVSAATGFVDVNSCDELLKISVFGRHGENQEVALGFVTGFGAQVGAVGTTINLDEKYTDGRWDKRRRYGTLRQCLDRLRRRNSYG